MKCTLCSVLWSIKQIHRSRTSHEWSPFRPQRREWGFSIWINLSPSCFPRNSFSYSHVLHKTDVFALSQSVWYLGYLMPCYRSPLSEESQIKSQRTPKQITAMTYVNQTKHRAAGYETMPSRSCHLNKKSRTFSTENYGHLQRNRYLACSALEM